MAASPPFDMCVCACMCGGAARKGKCVAGKGRGQCLIAPTASLDVWIGVCACMWCATARELAAWLIAAWPPFDRPAAPMYGLHANGLFGIVVCVCVCVCACVYASLCVQMY